MLARHGLRPRGIIHIGAHHCEERSEYHDLGVDDDRILWVEANPDIVSRVRNRLPGTVRIVQAAISDKARAASFHVTNNGMSSSLLELAEHKKQYPHIHVTHTLELETTTLPALLETLELEPSAYDTLVMDIQGAELLALRGMVSILHHFSSIFIEVNIEELYAGCGRLCDIHPFLEHHGFKLTDIDMTPHGWGDALFIRRG